MNNTTEIVCLGVDGQYYRIPRFIEMRCNSKGIPIGYPKVDVPIIPIVARVYSTNEGESHPLRKAYFKFLTAKSHNIFVKQRPQDVTIDEALQMVKDALKAEGFEDSEVEYIIRKYWS